MSEIALVQACGILDAADLESFVSRKLTSCEKETLNFHLSRFRSDNTRKAYEYQWRLFVSWCFKEGFVPFPATVEVVWSATFGPGNSNQWTPTRTLHGNRNSYVPAGRSPPQSQKACSGESSHWLLNRATSSLTVSPDPARPPRSHRSLAAAGSLSKRAPIRAISRLTKTIEASPNAPRLDAREITSNLNILV